MVLYLRLIDVVVAVERRRDPRLAGHPLVVGGAATSRGHVMAASDEAREAGVAPGQRLFEAKSRCPGAIFLPGRVERYLDVWSQAAEVVATTERRADWIGLDEICVDLPDRTAAAARIAAEHLRDRVALATGLPVACGIAATRVAARVAAIRAGPSGLLLVLPGYDRAFLERCELRLLEGLDALAVERLGSAGIHTIGALAALGPGPAISLLGRGGAVLAQLARGDDTRVAGVLALPVRLAREAPVGTGEHGGGNAISEVADVAARLADTLHAYAWIAARIEIEVESRGGFVATASRPLDGRVTRAGMHDLVAQLWPRVSAHAQPGATLTVRLRDVRREVFVPSRTSSRTSAPRRALGS